MNRQINKDELYYEEYENVMNPLKHLWMWKKKNIFLKFITSGGHNVRYDYKFRHWK